MTSLFDKDLEEITFDDVCAVVERDPSRNALFELFYRKAGTVPVIAGFYFQEGGKYVPACVTLRAFHNPTNQDMFFEDAELELGPFNFFANPARAAAGYLEFTVYSREGARAQVGIETETDIVLLESTFLLPLGTALGQEAYGVSTRQVWGTTLDEHGRVYFQKFESPIQKGDELLRLYSFVAPEHFRAYGFEILALHERLRDK